MEQWMDSLSEEWISQPRSSTPASMREGPSKTSTTSSAPQSRIPRFKARSTSNPSALEGGSIAQRESSLALIEKKVSDLNASSKRSPKPSIKHSGQENRASPAQSIRRHTSTNSASSVQQGTVQCKVPRTSPINKENLKGTPNWKRRVIDGLGKPGEQRDLFSPMGLEHVFRPPSTRKKSQHRKERRYEPLAADEFPSSPPPFPQLGQDASQLPQTGAAAAPEVPSPYRGSLANQHNLPDVEKSTKFTNQQSNAYFPTDSKTVSNGMPEEHLDTSEGGATRESSSQPDNHLPTTVYDVNSTCRRNGPSQALKSKDHSRIASTNSDLRNEDISVVSLPRFDLNHSLIRRPGGDMAKEQRPLNSGYVTTGSQPKRCSCASDDEIDYRDNEHPKEVDSLTGQSVDLTSHSLPNDLSTGTPEFAPNSAFVNIRRGGYSSESSFRARPLSSPFSRSNISAEDFPVVPQNFKTRVSQALPPVSQRLSFSSSSSTGSVIGPKTPTKFQQDGFSSPDRPRSSGSPLKLFDKYDTFTNDRLVRRLSQFEESFQESCSEPSSENSKSQRTLNNCSSNTQRPRPRKSKSIPSRNNTRITSFGDGDLDTCNFMHRSPYYQPKLELSDDLETDPPLPEVHRNSQTRFKKRSTSASTASSRWRRTMTPMEGLRERPQGEGLVYPDDGQLENNIQYAGPPLIERTKTNPGEDATGEKKGKRSLNSPTKVSQPKRRRTLNADPVSTHDPGSAKNADGDVGPTHPLLSVIGKKRKDARYDDVHQVAHPRVLATRQMLRPRTPTPSQTRVAGQHSAKSTPFVDKKQSITASKTADVHATVVVSQYTAVDSPTQILAGELLNFAIDVAKDLTSDTRKVSVTTADFSNAANLVMQQIRAKDRPRHEDNNSKVTDTRHLDNIQESYNEESTQEEFSRPPSREGGSYRKLRELKQLDPRVISHLRKFEDKDDLGIALTSSLTSLRLGEYESPAELAEVESDPPNVRIRSIRGPGGLNYIESTERDEHCSTTQSDAQSRHSNPSSKTSTASLNASGSSTGSGNKAVIGPDKISHLISDQIGGMTFDRTKQLWVRRKTSNGKSNNGFDGNGSDLTEEDPLGDIPDLSVDEQEELERVRTAALRSRPPSSGDTIACQAQQALSVIGQEVVSIPAQEKSTTRIKQHAGRSACSKDSRLGLSEPEIESRSTSCGHELPVAKAVVAANQGAVSTGPTQNDEHQDEVEHEISIFEGRSTTPPLHAQLRHRQPRVVTVAFSSPLISHFQELHKPTESNDIWEDESDLDLSDSPDRPQTNRESRPLPQSSQGGTSVMSLRHSVRRVSVSKHGYLKRPVSRIDEHGEFSLHDDLRLGKETSVDVVLTTPQTTRDIPSSLLIPSQSAGGRSDVTFHLSPLPDFTLQEKDESMIYAVGRVVKRRGLLSDQEVEERFSLAIKELVEKITDVEPYEPYWENIRKLDLRGKGIHTLHKLDNFCGRIEELNVSDNELDQLDGAPSSLRVLGAQRNALSNLTGWSHLQNLQYLDVSGNQLQSLRGFQGLCHLRELRADDNQIDSLDGICSLNGLIKLRLRRNQIIAIDFGKANLQRLVELDLQGNKIVRASHLHQLPVLSLLDLSDNGINDLEPALVHAIPSLHTLDVSGNNLSSIDITNLPSLRNLNLDGNHISKVNGLDALSRMESLSWRKQTHTVSQNDLMLETDDCCEVKFLCFSGNNFTTFSPQATFHNLQTLELASVGVQTLSPNFGLEMPNLRSLNLNHNALKDIRPLLGIAKLGSLHLAGNRISRLRRTTSVLAKLGNLLEELDIRGNPLTVGFYPQTTVGHESSERRLIVTSTKVSSNPADEDEKEEGDPDEARQITAAYHYLLPHAHHDLDQEHRRRLDEDTALRRRVYEMLVFGGCKRLGRMDGLALERREKGRKDGVWERLLELGVLRGKKG
ncbi:MAG: hypothetical protein Q9187_004065, partial [Circinaria calcarea]